MSAMKLPAAKAPGVVAALGAAILFGASTPLAKIFAGPVAPVLLAGLLYLGSGVGLGLGRLVAQHRGWRSSEVALRACDVPWLLGAILTGGVIGPVLLMSGLRITPASSASLLLNLEGVLTALIAWFVFRENFDRRIFLGMVAITTGGILLSWEGGWETGGATGPLLIAGACLAWAIDNNLTRNISAGDPLQIATLKGLCAGVVNLVLALGTGARLPGATVVLASAAIGLLGYGVSLVLFVLALRSLGTARTGAYFSLAPFIGAAISLVLFSEKPTFYFWIATSCMALGLWLHLTEDHDHEHDHAEVEHEHAHVHDEHHQHEHGPDDPSGEPHSHRHRHPAMRHAHPHYPDLHHRHDH